MSAIICVLINHQYLNASSSLPSDHPSDFRNSSDDLVYSRILLFIFASTCLLLLSTLIILIVLRMRRRDEMRSGNKNFDLVKGTDQTCKHGKSEMLMSSSLRCDTKSDSQLAISTNQHQSLHHPFSTSQISHNQILPIGHTPFSHLQAYSEVIEHSDQSKWILLGKTVNPDVIPQGKWWCNSSPTTDLVVIETY